MIAASDSFRRIFQVQPDPVGTRFGDLGEGEWNVPQLLRATVSGVAAIDAYEMDLVRKEHKTCRLVLRAHKLDYCDADNVRIVLSVADVTEARLAEKLKDDLVREKQILLQELQHRVANSLQIIASVLMQYHKLTTMLGDLRNKAGTVSHGKEPFLLKLSLHQRRAALLAADAIVTFLHEAYLEHEPELVRTLEPYERFERMNALIDDGIGISAVEEEESAMVRIDFHLPNGDVLPLAVEASRLLFEFDREAYVAAVLACREATTQSDLPSSG